MAASITITRNKTIPNSADKSDFHDLVDTATATISGIDQTDLASGVGTVIKQTTAPSDTDQIWVDSSVTPYVVRIYDGTEWITTGGYAVMTNKSGGQRVLGDVCVIDGTTAGSFTTTTTQCDPKQVVVVMETIDANSDGVVATSGARITNLKMEGACKPGDWIATASTAVKGVVSGVNTFACALASLSGAGTLAEALLSNKGVSPSNVPTEGQFLKQGASVPAWASIVSAIKNYGTSGSTASDVTITDIKIAYGTLTVAGDSTGTITNLPFTNATSYIALVSMNDSDDMAEDCGIERDSGAQCTVRNSNGTERAISWFAIGT